LRSSQPDDDNADGDGDDNKNGDDEDDDFDDEDDFETDAMSPDELARAERANEAINCGGVLVWQSQWLLQQPSTGHDVMDAVTAALDGLNAQVDSLTASLCPPQDAAYCERRHGYICRKCVAIGDLLLREAEKMGASAESAERTVRAALAKLRAASS
jgi:hypothetical protein